MEYEYFISYRKYRDIKILKIFYFRDEHKYGTYFLELSLY